LTGVASTAGVLVDTNAPTVASIVPTGSSPTNASTLSFTVTFSEGVTGVDSSDFTLTRTGNANGTVASVAPNSSSVYTVTVTGVTGDGTLRLDLNGSGTGIADLATNPIQGGFSGGTAYTVDRVAPTVTAVNVPPNGDYDTGRTLSFSVQFSEPVVIGSGGVVPDLTINAGGKTVQAAYVSGAGTNTLVFQFTVGSGDSAPQGIAIEALIAGSLTDAAGNPTVATLPTLPSTAGITLNAVAAFTPEPAPAGGWPAWLISALSLLGFGVARTRRRKQERQ
jgi:hypothetical protein